MVGHNIVLCYTLLLMTTHNMATLYVVVNFVFVYFTEFMHLSVHYFTLFVYLQGGPKNRTVFQT